MNRCLYSAVFPSRDDGPLPEGVELVGGNLTVQGPVKHQHAGLYECVASYDRFESTLQFIVTVPAHVAQPGRCNVNLLFMHFAFPDYEMLNLLSLPLLSVPPTIRVDLQTEGGYSLIECSAAEAFPAANLSWLLPEGVSGVSWFNFTSHNGSHSVRGVLLLPACPPRELTAECLINHPAFEKPENRSITLPLCGMFNKSHDE